MSKWSAICLTIQPRTRQGSFSGPPEKPQKRQLRMRQRKLRKSSGISRSFPRKPSNNFRIILNSGFLNCSSSLFYDAGTIKEKARFPEISRSILLRRHISGSKNQPQKYRMDKLDYLSRKCTLLRMADLYNSGLVARNTLPYGYSGQRFNGASALQGGCCCNAGCQPGKHKCGTNSFGPQFPERGRP